MITVYYLLRFPLEVFIQLQTCVTVWNSLSVSCHFHFQVGQAALFVFGCVDVHHTAQQMLCMALDRVVKNTEPYKLFRIVLFLFCFFRGLQCYCFQGKF